MFSEVQNFPFTAFFPMSLFFMAKKSKKKGQPIRKEQYPRSNPLLQIGGRTIALVRTIHRWQMHAS
jgi:hypothetical protein